MADIRALEHVACDCVPDLGPPHCHLCSERAGSSAPWDEAHPHDTLMNILFQP